MTDEANSNKATCERSGSIESTDPLVSFLYLLMRDELAPGTVEKLVCASSSDEKALYTNGWLASYAIDIADRLRAPFYQRMDEGPPGGETIPDLPNTDIIKSDD